MDIQHNGTSPGTGDSNPGNDSAEVIMEQPGTGRGTPMSLCSSITLFNIAYTKTSTASDQWFPINYSNSIDGNTIYNATAAVAMFSPASFMVFQYYK
ncbi:hypothetical protein [Caballeronia sp. LZ035]|uniref:hypothetical protein n=1 Tax=Caballeronia sp. LZ035 TaxID=3038568 RepID=UPI00286131B9|nr:hypothetical protein [Caballeronia sp. LZ035]MDR5762891.1 hypothetical protein [Caballeronia sp. LZ035]